MSPRIPTYQSQRNIQANIAEPLRDEAAQPFQEQQKVLGVMQGIAQKWSDAHDVMQYTEAKAKYEIATADIMSRAAADPNFKDSAKYYKELEDAKSNSMKGISNQQVGNKLGLELNYGNQIAGIKIDADFKEKELKANQYNLSTTIEAKLKAKLGATEAEAAHYDDEIRSLLVNHVQAGTVTQEEADKLLREAQKTDVKYQIYADTSTAEKDSEILKALKDPKGRFSYLDSKTRLDMVEESQRRIFQNNQTFKRENEISKDSRFQNIFKKMNEGTLTMYDLDVEQAAADANLPGALTQKEILAIREGHSKDIKADVKMVAEYDQRAEKYLDFFEKFIDDATDREKGREAIINAFKDGNLSANEANYLNTIVRETEEIKWSREVKPNNMIPFKNAITAIGSWFRGKENSSEKDAALAIKNLLRLLADGEDIDKTVADILSKDRVSTKPDIKSFPETGQLMVDPVTGVKALVFPDGHIESVK